MEMSSCPISGKDLIASQQGILALATRIPTFPQPQAYMAEVWCDTSVEVKFHVLGQSGVFTHMTPIRLSVYLEIPICPLCYCFLRWEPASCHVILQNTAQRAGAFERG